MNILLINPAQLKVYGKLSPHLQLPLGLAYLGAFLRKHGYTVTVIDMHAERIAPKDLIRIIKGSFFDIVGITVATPTLNSALQVAELVKRAAPKVKVVFGGMHPSVLPKETIAYNQVDFVVKGEGEFTLLELVRAVESNGDLRGIDGLVLKSENKIVENKERKLIDNLDSLPFPARDLFKIKSYSYPDSLYAATAPIMTSRGCFGECVFCGSHCIFGRKFRARSAGNVVDEIELLARESRIKEIHIWDDSFANQKERVHQIKDEILRRNLRLKFAFPNGIRADLLDKEVMQSLKAMGTYSIAIGIESGNQAVLDKAKKHIKLEKIREAFALAREFHFETWGFFMFGIPGERLNQRRTRYNLPKSLIRISRNSIY